MKRFFTIALLASAALTAGAQSVGDAYLYSQNQYSGTARSVGMGNAMTAVGGDLGSIVFNPAGSAVAGYSQFSITPDVTISSINAMMVRPNIGNYCAAKGGIVTLTKSMATEWGEYNITVNAIGPGYFLTDLTKPLAEDPEFDAWVKSEVPLGRWGRPEELVGLAVMLASGASDYISGQTIYVDGGWQACL